ncbi:AI-2E family transporter [Streptococcus sanguinis]
MLFIGLVALVILNASSFISGAISLFDVISTLIYGAVIAFVLNVPMKKIEQYLVKLKVKAELRRPIAMVLVFLALILIVIALLVLVLPTLAQTISQLGTVLTQLGKLLGSSEFVTKDMLSTIVSGIQGQSSSISQALIGFLSGLTSNIGNIFSSLMNAFLIIVFTFSFLSSKEHLAAMTSRLLKVFLPEKVVIKLTYIGQVALEAYDQFLMSQLIEAVIIGVMIAVGYSVFGIPYGVMTGIFAGVLSFIPYVGPMIACVVGAIFIFTVSPTQALLSLLLYQVIQLIEGNLIYPRVVGQSIGLPAIFTLAAASIGGNLFGLLGMIFFTPIFAVIYRLVKEFVVAKENQLD